MTEVPAHLDEQAALWRSVSAGRRVTVMLDNALSAAQVRPLLPGAAPDSLVAVTSRNRLPGLGVDGAAFHHLRVLTTGAAVELLTRRVGGDRVDREPEAARTVVSLCSRLPLAVCLAGAQLAARPRQPVSAMAGALGRDDARLATLEVEGDRAVEVALNESYAGLSSELARGYRHLGLPPVTVFTAPIAAAACAVSLDSADQLLDELTEKNLMEDLAPESHTGHGRYRFHDLVRLHASRLAASMDAPGDRRDTVRRVVDLLLERATAAEAVLSPSHRTLSRDYSFPPHNPTVFAGERDALDWLDAERSHLMAALRTAAEQGWDATAWQLADAMWPLFLRLRPYDLWIEAHEIGLAAARRAGDPAAESRMLTSGGAGLRNAGRHDEAVRWFAQALGCARRDNDRRAQAQALHGLGQSHRLAGRLGTALPHFADALRLREAIGYRRGAALTRLAMGDIALATGRPDDALRLLDQARTALLAEADGYDAARALAYLAQAHARAGHGHATAEEMLRQAADEFTTAGSVHWQARTREFLGDLALERGEAATARHWFEESLELYEPVSAEDTRRLRGRLRELT